MIRNKTDPISALNEFILPKDAGTITDISLNKPDPLKVSSDDYLENIEKCVSYVPKLLDFLIPQIEILDKLCISYDKTYLFLVCFMRCLIYMLLTKLYYDTFGIENDLSYLTFLVLVIWCILNIVFMIIVMFKQTKLSSYSLAPTQTNSDNSNIDGSGVQLSADIYAQ
jgi:hypothetical protein